MLFRLFIRIWALCGFTDQDFRNAINAADTLDHLYPDFFGLTRAHDHAYREMVALKEWNRVAWVRLVLNWHPENALFFGIINSLSPEQVAYQEMWEKVEAYIAFRRSILCIPEAVTVSFVESKTGEDNFALLGYPDRQSEWVPLGGWRPHTAGE